MIEATSFLDAAAGIGMLLGLVIYIAGRRHLPPDPPLSAYAKLRSRAAIAMVLAITAMMISTTT